MGDQAARAVRARASADARLARQLHVHQGDGRARGRDARGVARRAAVDRAPLDHRVLVRAPVPRVDRGVQDGRADHPGLRPRHDPGLPRHPRGHHRHHPGRLRRQRDAGRRREPARARDARLLPRVVGVSEPVAVQGSVRERQGVLRARSAAAAGPRRGQGARVDVPRQPPRRTPPAHRRTRRRRGRQGRHPPAEVQAHARPRRARRPRQGAGGLRAPVLGPVRRVHRGRGDLHGRPDGRAVGWADGGRPEDGSRSTRR